jgi:hypothetical protein
MVTNAKTTLTTVRKMRAKAMAHATIKSIRTRVIVTPVLRATYAMTSTDALTKPAAEMAHAATYRRLARATRVRAPPATRATTAMSKKNKKNK